MNQNSTEKMMPLESEFNISVRMSCLIIINLPKLVIRKILSQFRCQKRIKNDEPPTCKRFDFRNKFTTFPFQVKMKKCQIQL